MSESSTGQAKTGQAKRAGPLGIAAAAWSALKKVAGDAARHAAGVCSSVVAYFHNANLALVLLLTALLLALGAVCALIAFYVFQALPPVPQTRIADPFSLLAAVGVSFAGFLVVLHAAAIRIAWPKDKRLLYAIDYAYLGLAALSLVGVLSYGADQVAHFRNEYAVDERRYRDAVTQRINQLDDKSKCAFRVGGDATGYCAWLRSARALANEALVSHDEVEALARAGRRVINALGDSGDEEFVRTVEQVRVVLDVVAERVSVGSTLSELVQRAKAPAFLKLYSFYLLAFAAALRITKVSMEMLGLVVTGGAPRAAAGEHTGKD